MQLKPLAFAAAAAAMLIVPETSEQGEGVFKALPVHADTLSVPSSAVAQTVRVPCAQCKGSDTQLKLDFAVEGGSRLMLNGFELYPTADPWNGDLSAVVVKADGHEKEQRLGYSLSIEPEAVDQDLQMQLIAVELRVIEVGSRYVEGVPTVRLQVLRAADDEIAIANVALIESPVSGCTTMLCRAKHLTGDMLKSLKGFKGGKGCGRHRNKGHPHHDGTGPGGVMPLHGGRPPHPHPHRPHPHHHHMGPHRHDWRKLMKNVASHIFLPVLMGITAGVGVAVIAMVLCSVLVRVTRLATCKRAGARCCRRKQATPQQDSDVEKVGLMSEEEHEEPHPQYRDDETK